ncbi:MAG: O-antigen ligase family protein [Anaerolineales bacterium]|nr:O-antigen ligase family protein [Anaerolineales bacterium]
MTVNRNDFIYMIMAVGFAVAGVMVISNPDALIGLYFAAAMLGIGLVMAIYIKPSLGADILIIAVFTNISRTFTDNGLPSVIKPLVAIVALAILVRYINAAQMPGGRDKTRGVEAFLFFYFMMVAFSYITADNKERAAEAIIDLGKDIVIIYCIFFTLRRPETWKQSAWIVILVTAFLSLLGVYQAFTGNYDQQFFGLARALKDVSTNSTTYRLAGPIKEPNMWGQVVVAVVPLVLFRIIYERRMRMRLLGVGILGILLIEILNTYSRGAYLGLVFVSGLVLLSQRPHPLIWFAGVATVVLVFPFLPSSYTDRFETITLLNSDGIYQEASFRGRTSKILTGLIMFSNNPILGVGAGNYPNNYQKYTIDVGLERASGEQDPHSLYVQILAETGILGGITFLGFASLLLINFSRSIQSIKNFMAYQSWLPWLYAIQISVIGYLFTSLFLHGGYIRFYWILVALALAAIQLTEESLIDPDQKHLLELPV